VKRDERCSFCDKRSDEVRKLVVSENANICDECVDLCAVLCEPNKEEADATS